MHGGSARQEWSRAGSCSALRSAWIRVAVLGAAACASEAAGPVALPMTQLPAPRSLWDAEAGPIVARRCGTAGCHAEAARPLRLHAPGGWRLPPVVVGSMAPLVAGEQDANHATTLGFIDADAPRATTLVRKAVGGLGHGGGAVFPHASDPECRAVERWLRGQER